MASDGEGGREAQLDSLGFACELGPNMPTKREHLLLHGAGSGDLNARGSVDVSAWRRVWP